jgi:hypothetical protein
MAVTGTPAAVRVGPGKILIAPIGTAEPTNLATVWDVAWVELGYTMDGSSYVFDQTFEDVNVAEEYDPIQTLQTARQITINVNAAQTTAKNLQLAFNGGTITTAAGLVTFEPPDPGVYTPVMLGWEADDNLERWIFRRCVQVGSVEIGRRRAPDAASVPLSFRATKPATLKPFKVIQDADWVQGVPG